MLKVFSFVIYLLYKGRDYMTHKLQKFREDLHQIPEIALKEYKTKEYLWKALTDMGYKPIPVLETGILVYIDQHHKETIAFRSDIDALPVQEANTVPFISKHEGAMHACGHDGHMAMLLGFADFLKDKQHTLQKNVLLIFQPAEESIGGAKMICDLDVLETYHVTSIFGIHLFPDLEEGVLGTKPGEFMAMASEVNITVHGTAAHGAMPQNGVDANVIMAKLLIELQNIQTRLISPLEYTIITFGKISGGFVRNVISDHAEMEGTIRVFNKETFNRIITSIKNIIKGYETTYGCTITLDYTDGYLAVINDPSLFTLFKQANKEFPIHEFEKPLMIAEDFSFYQTRVPGLFYYVGIKNPEEGYIHPLHSSEFNFSPKALSVGLQTYINMAYATGMLNE